MTKLIIAILLAGALAVSGRDETPGRPTVSRREADLIARVNGIAETNVQAAVSLLLAQDDGNLNAALEFVLANLHVRQDALPDAAARFEQALDKAPDFVEARRNLGRVLLLLERYPDAAAQFRLLALRPDADAELFLLLGHTDFMDDKPVSAESAYRQALLRNPELDDASRGLVKALIRQERYQEAAALCRELLRRHPADAELWSLRANALLALDRSADAIRTLETAHRLGSLDNHHQLTLADLYINAQQPEDALRLYRAVIGQSGIPAGAAIRAVRGFLMLGDAVRARLILGETALAPDTLSPEDRQSVNRLQAEVALLESDYEQGREHLARVLEYDPLDGRALLLSARIAAALGEPEEAAMTYERAARLPEVRVEALRAHAQLEAGRRRYRTAARLLEAAQTLDPHPAVGRYLEQIRRLESLQENAPPQP